MIELRGLSQARAFTAEIAVYLFGRKRLNGALFLTSIGTRLCSEDIAEHRHCNHCGNA